MWVLLFCINEFVDLGNLRWMVLEISFCKLVFIKFWVVNFFFLCLYFFNVFLFKLGCVNNWLFVLKINRFCLWLLIGNWESSVLSVILFFVILKNLFLR